MKTMIPLAALASLALTASTTAALVITPAGADSTTTIGGSRTIGATIDGALLSSGGTSSNILTETVGNAGSAAHWLSASTAMGGSTTSTTEVLTFTLSEASDVDTIHLWSYNRAERTRGVKTFDISFSTDSIGTAIGSLTFPTTITGATLGDFTMGSTGTDTSVQTKTFANQTGVTHIRFTNLTTFGSTSYVAISELRFGSAVPEPTTTALLGLGGLALILRRRK